MSLRTGSHWAAGVGGVARKALQVIIKDSVYTAVADQTLTFNCRYIGGFDAGREGPHWWQTTDESSPSCLAAQIKLADVEKAANVVISTA